MRVPRDTWDSGSDVTRKAEASTRRHGMASYYRAGARAPLAHCHPGGPVCRMRVRYATLDRYTVRGREDILVEQEAGERKGLCGWYM